MYPSECLNDPVQAVCGWNRGRQLQNKRSEACDRFNNRSRITAWRRASQEDLVRRA
jgi:hypothetical protein